MDRQLFQLLRVGRRAALRSVSALDLLVNRLNGKRPFPPLYMRREVGPLRVFETAAAQMVKFLEYEAGLKPSTRLLDMGCGCGAIPLVLNQYGDYAGDYHGLDVDRRMIAWCQKHLASPRMKFTHHDYWNATYNPSGVQKLAFAVEDGWADIVLMKSILTHLLPDDGAWYIQETARCLAPGGTAVITAQLYDDLTPEIERRYPFDGGTFRYAREESPESSIALSRRWVDQQMAANGLTYKWLPMANQGPMIIRRT